MTLGCLRFGFSEFRNFDFWSQIQAGSNLEKLGEHLGTYVLRSVWGLESHCGGGDCLWESAGRCPFQRFVALI